MKNVKLFCIPYAGGSAMVYKKWEKNLDDSIKLEAIELAGRGSRGKEPYYKNRMNAIDDIFNFVKENIGDSEYAIFGHSMGCILAYYLAAKIKNSDLKQPMHVFISSRYPPSIKKEERNTYLLPEKELIQKAVSMGSIPENLFRFKVFIKKAMDTLRADYRILEMDGYDPIIDQLNCDISVLHGNDDELSEPSEMQMWAKYTNKKCSFYVFDGGHFYLHNNTDGIVNIINKTLIGYME